MYLFTVHTFELQIRQINTDKFTQQRCTDRVLCKN